MTDLPIVDPWHGSDCPACDSIEPTAFHACRTVLWVVDHWVCASDCHFGATVEQDPPGLKGRVA